MQRQSLGSPASRLPIHYHTRTDDDDEKKKKKKREVTRTVEIDGEELLDVDKAEEPILWTSSAATYPTTAAAATERSIHLIPLLTLLCFLVLYLCSHDPSPSDLVGLGGFGRLFDPKVSGEEIGQYGGVSTATATALRSQRSLKEAERHHRHSRRLGRWATSAT